MKRTKHIVVGILFLFHINTIGLQAQEIINAPAILSDTLVGHSDEGDVIVSALFRPQTLSKSVYQVRVLDAKRIASQGALRVQDVLRTELNIRFRQDLALGGSNMNVGGMTGENVKILLNGVPIVGRQGTANEVDINQIDINTIERIEIVEGPMSTIYGSDAIAGIINIITKQNTRKGVTGRISAHEETVGSDYGLQQGLRMQAAQLGWASQKWSVQGGVGHYHFMGWQGDTSGRVMTWKPKQQYTGFGTVRYKAKLWDANYRIDVLDETIVNAGNFIFNTANDQRFVTGRLAQQLQINVRPYKDWLVQGMVAHTLFTRETINTEVDRATGLQYFSSAPGDVTQFTGTAFRLNASKKLKDNFDMQAGVDGNFDNGTGGRLKPGSNLITDLGLFVVPEWTVGKRLVLKPGLRMLYNSVYHAPPVVPSLNAKIALSEKAEARLAYARGFRAPSLRELYFFFFDANHQIQGNPNLRPETSDSYQAAVKWNLSSKDDKTRMHVQASAFYNHVMDKIGMAQDAVNPQLTT